MGTVVVSVDAELGWGYHDLESPPERRLRNARNGWQQLVDLFDEFEVPATWAVVGHLFHTDCDGVHDHHPAGADWFAGACGSDTSRELWFADGLIEAVRDASVPHELACHTYSHVEFDESRMESEPTRELMRAEIRASIDAANERGISLSSMVFPRNRPAHLDVLAEEGIECYRGQGPEIAQNSLLRIGKKVAGATIAPRSPALVEPYVDEHGLVNVPDSMYLFQFEGLMRSLVEPTFGDPVVRTAKEGIDQAATTDGTFHMWFHPNNLIGDQQIQRVRSILTHLHARREDSNLGVAPMADVAAGVRGECRT